MKQRITFISHTNNDAGKNLSVEKKQVKIQGLEAAKEHKTTLSIDELPKSGQRIPDIFQELYVRWVSSKAHSTSSPFNARLSPGLHIFWTPARASGHAKEPDRLVCSMIKRFFSTEIKCDSEHAFSTPPSSQFAHSISRQFYTQLSSLPIFWQDIFCDSEDRCPEALTNLDSLSYLDLNYDAISQTVSTITYSPHSTHSEIYEPTENFTAELGLLHTHQDPSVESTWDLTLAGSLITLSSDGPNPSPKATTFSFPSRHLTPNVPQRFNSSFDRPTGLHPTLRLTFPDGPPDPPLPSCRLHAYFTLPSTLFLDKYSFHDTLTLKSHNLTALHSLSGATDLEAPEWNVPTWGSAALFELAPNTTSATVPLHLRYLEPAPGGYQDVYSPVPAVFWACHAEEGAKFAVNPFDRTHLGYDGLFGDRTGFFHLEPVHSGMLPLSVPVLDTNAVTYPLIDHVTILVILAGFCFVVWKATGSRAIDKPGS